MAESNILKELEAFMDRNYKKQISMETIENLRFRHDGKEVFLQLKYFQSSKQLIIKEVSITPKGGNLLTASVKLLLENPKRHVWGLTNVVLESIMDPELIEKLKRRGWQSKFGNHFNLFLYGPEYKEPSFDDFF